MVCHNPSNAGQQNPLLMLSYPNQALTLRHETGQQITEKLMPPPAGGINPEKRQVLVDLAKAVAAEADWALAYEGEGVVPVKQ